MSEHSKWEKSIKNIMILLGLLIASPILLSLAFKALRIFKEFPKNFIGYFLIIGSIFLTLFTVYFGFKTFKAILDTLFKD